MLENFVSISGVAFFSFVSEAEKMQPVSFQSSNQLCPLLESSAHLHIVDKIRIAQLTIKSHYFFAYFTADGITNNI